MLKIFDDKIKLSFAFCDELLNMSGEKNVFNIALSGGSTPRIIFQTLAEKFRGKIDWEKIHLFWGDERCVPPDDEESNFGMTKKYLLDYIDIPPKNIHPVNGNNIPEKEAERYSTELKKFLPVKNYLPVFDLIMLGIGEDGHTASIFPDQMKLLNSEKICEVSFHPLSKQKRITLTGKVIDNAERIIFLITGKSKSEIFNRILENRDEPVKKYPAAAITPVNGRIEYFADKEASGLLTGTL